VPEKSMKKQAPDKEAWKFVGNRKTKENVFADTAFSDPRFCLLDTLSFTDTERSQKAPWWPHARLHVYSPVGHRLFCGDKRLTFQLHTLYFILCTLKISPGILHF
jgi:hypothetical protein